MTKQDDNQGYTTEHLKILQGLDDVKNRPTQCYEYFLEDEVDNLPNQDKEPATNPPYPPDCQENML